MKRRYQMLTDTFATLQFTIPSKLANTDDAFQKTLNITVILFVDQPLSTMFNAEALRPNCYVQCRGTATELLCSMRRHCDRTVMFNAEALRPNCYVQCRGTATELLCSMRRHCDRTVMFNAEALRPNCYVQCGGTATELLCSMQRHCDRTVDGTHQSRY